MQLAVSESDMSKLISDYVFTSKYARYRPDLRRRENWSEAVERVEAMHLRRFEGLREDELKEIRWAFDMVRDRRVLTSMRAMQFGGPAIEAHHAKIYNCLGRETEFVTSEGVRSFRDFEDGDRVIVRGHTGMWRHAVVRNYGTGTLYPITIRRGRGTQTINATADHRWMNADGIVTEGTTPKAHLRGAEDTFAEFVYEEATPEERLYWAYGYVYGDGTTLKNSDGDPTYSMVRLCGQDAQRFEHRFVELGFKTSRSQSLGGDCMVFTGRYLKDAPNPAVDPEELIRAFVCGYLDADGGKRNGSKNRYASIQSSDKDHIEFIRTCFPVAGMYITGETELTGQDTNYGVRPYTVKFTLSNYFSNREFVPASSYRVESIGEGFEGELWCLEVEEDQTFTLPSGLVTGNCALTHIAYPEVFQDIFYLLLCGCGVGYSVMPHLVDKLPELYHGPELGRITHVIGDSIEGWADAIGVLMRSAFVGFPESGFAIDFDPSQVRPEGSPIKTGGGKAPGPDGLMLSLSKIRDLLSWRMFQGQTRLEPIDCFDVISHMADAVLSGGVRRSACLALFDKNDAKMMASKTGDWFDKNPQRARANISVLLVRGDTSLQEFESVLEATREWGEPGFVFADTKDVVTNPCGEIQCIPVTKDGRHGVQMCNLTSIVGSRISTPEEYLDAARAAAIIGTLQASYTDFKYLGSASKEITEDEALLGVSMTAILDNPKLLLNEELQRFAAATVVSTNFRWAKILGINPAARATTIKPEGTSTIVVGSMASGIHASHARYMIRRVQANKNETVYRYFKQFNGELCEESVWSANQTDDVINFPIKVPDDAILKEDLDAISHLEIIKSTYLNWVVHGTTQHNEKPITHNVSCTVTVEDGEWDAVAEYLFENRHNFAAVSLLPSHGDKSYKQAPMEAVKTDSDFEYFKFLADNVFPINYDYMVEEEDNTKLSEEIACGGAQGCDLK